MAATLPSPPDPLRVLILGSTGSIGTQTIEVVDHLNAPEGGPRIEIVGLCAHSSGDRLFAQARRLGVKRVGLVRPPSACPADLDLIAGDDAGVRLVERIPCDLVVGAMVGIAGLAPVLRAIELGRDIALANKETLVAAGSIVMPAARARGVRLLPIDSEHAGAWQLLRSLDSSYVPPAPAPEGIRRLTLTASGGPFRTACVDRIARATPDEALSHPTWAMGTKNTLDSATLVNKALELIEAHWLFDLDSERLDAVIQPTSMVHALLALDDGTVLAQISPPDMRLPIQQALTWPARLPAAGHDDGPIDLASLRFEAIDEHRFPAITLARRVMRAGGSAGCVFNAINEVAGRAFLDRRIPLPRICELLGEGLDEIPVRPIESLEDVMRADGEARAWACERIERTAAPDLARRP